MIKHLWVNLLWKSKPLGFRKYTVGGVVQVSLWSSASTWDSETEKSSLFRYWTPQKQVFRVANEKGFQNLFFFKNKTCFKASVSQRKSSELNSVLPGISVLKKLFSSEAVAFFTVMFNDFPIFLYLFFLRCFLKCTAEETNNKKINL